MLLNLPNIVSRYTANFMPLLSAKLVLKLSIALWLFLNLSYFKSNHPYPHVLETNWRWLLVIWLFISLMPLVVMSYIEINDSKASSCVEW